MRKMGCKVCMKRFRNEAAFEDHMESDAHKKRVAEKDDAEARARDEARVRAELPRMRVADGAEKLQVRPVLRVHEVPEVQGYARRAR